MSQNLSCAVMIGALRVRRYALNFHMMVSIFQVCRFVLHCHHRVCQGLGLPTGRQVQGLRVQPQLECCSRRRTVVPRWFSLGDKISHLREKYARKFGRHTYVHAYKIQIQCSPFITHLARTHYTVISCLFVVQSKLLSRGTVDDLMHYCTRPKAECNSALGCPRFRGVIVWLYYKQVWNNCFITKPIWWNT